MRFFCLFVLFLIFITPGYAQELNCEVFINAEKALRTDPRVFNTLEQSILEFMNNRKWTDEAFEDIERIDCSIFIAIREQTGDQSYEATMTVISKRPVYNSSYNSTVLNIIDQDVSFQYQEFDPLEFNENIYTSNLTHILAYYAYLIIGMDYETFSLNGGASYLQKAQDIVNVVPAQTPYKGWKPYDKNQRNRYWTITQLLNGRYSPYREAQYEYYRLGLDSFYIEPDAGKRHIQIALEKWGEVGQDNPNLAIMQMWSEAKSQEINNIFSSGDSEEKATVLELLKKADPTNLNKYPNIQGKQ